MTDDTGCQTTQQKYNQPVISSHHPDSFYLSTAVDNKVHCGCIYSRKNVGVAVVMATVKRQDSFTTSFVLCRTRALYARDMKTTHQWLIVVYCWYACHLVNVVHYSSTADHSCRLSIHSTVVSLLTMYVAVAHTTELSSVCLRAPYD